MPLIAAAAVVTGFIEVSSLVAGLTYASAGLYVAGKATGNDTLMKLSTVTGLAAGAEGLYESLSNAGTLANSANSAQMGAPEAIGGGEAANVVTSPIESPVGYQDPTATQGIMNATTSDPMATSVTGSPDLAGASGYTPSAAPGVSEPLYGPEGAASQSFPINQDIAGDNASRGLLNAQKQEAFGQSLDQQVTGAAQAQTLPTNVSDVPMPAVTAAADPSMIDKAKAWWKTLSNTEKLAVGHFVEKGFGSIGDFVGPKADLMKAQAGLVNAQTGMTQQQSDNMGKPASKIPSLSYTFQPRVG